MFAKILVANRGEIAIRIFRTLPRARHRVASPSTRTPTARSLHVTKADEASASGPGPAAESYLRRRAAARGGAREAGAEAVHPGYGFLAENAGFARAVEEAGLVWIGPPPAAIELMGEKTRARAGDAGGRRADHPRHDRRGRVGRGGARRSATRSATRC